MRYAMGVPGREVRQYIRVSTEEHALQQPLLEGEVLVETDIRGAATISADGQAVIASPQPAPPAT